MRRVLRLIFAAILLSGWLLAAAAVHVIVLPGWSFGVLPKDRLGFTDTYVDARNWTAADAALHPALMKRIADAGKVDWLSSIAGTPGESLDARLAEMVKPGDAKPDARAEEKTAPKIKTNKGPH